MIRVGIGYDVHRLEPGHRLVIAGVEVPFHLGAVAHSDGDVAIHALCDAMLGALALGDIGSLYPDTDPAFRGIDSRLLLADTNARIRERGYCLGNADVAIMLQEPKLRPHIPAMRQALAEVLGVKEDQVSIKATTTERLGFVGMGQGLAAQAVVTLVAED